MHMIKNDIVDLAPDVISFQEVRFSHPDQHHQISDLANQLVSLGFNHFVDWRLLFLSLFSLRFFPPLAYF